jgi:selenocysteine-specific elongation factor
VLGTAGHVDHGKTTLVRALTGKDTDRLAEETARGLSIELGYTRLELPSGRTLSVVDVPGHERFVRTMVAGATGVDLFLLCMAADDGVMPAEPRCEAPLVVWSSDRLVLRRLAPPDTIGGGVVLNGPPRAEPPRARPEPTRSQPAPSSDAALRMAATATGGRRAP